MIQTRVQIRDSGMDDFLRKMKKLKGHADIGVFGDTDSEEVIIAATHEFGTDKAGKGHNIRIPERSFLRSTLEEQKEETRKHVDRAKIAIVTGRESKARFLNRLGLWFVGKVQEKIRTGPFKENAKSVKIQKILKGRIPPKPLIDEGHLLQSIVHRVRDGGEP